MKLANFILLFLVIFIISGCGSSNEEKQTQYNFKQGLAELKINLLENAPPEKIYPESDFPFIVELDNQAAYDIRNGELRIVGLDPAYFDIYPLSENFDLLGKSLTNPAGQKDYLEFSGRSGQLFENSEEHSADFLLKAVYSSEVDFTDTICINTDAYNIFDSGCTSEEAKSYSGQGAPIAVTSLEQVVSPGNAAELELRIKIENKGSGRVNRVVVETAQLGGELLTCIFNNAGQGVVYDFPEDEEKKQEVILICKKSLRGQRSYETTLSVALRYDYELQEEKTLNLVK